MNSIMDKYKILKTYFGHMAFREGQEVIIDCLLRGQDLLCVMPTGGGKSICYQVPALLFDGITIVVSPLISLMKDQVNALTQMGIAAAYINSSLTAAQHAEVLRRAENGWYKIIYVAPERLLNDWFLYFCKRANISMLAIDEAHCVSQWGHDFRPSYTKIQEFIEELPTRPVLGAFTATATDTVRDDILRLLKLRDPFVMVSGFNRKNLYFEVRKPKSKDSELLKIIYDYMQKSGIVYCATRRAVEEVCELLCERGFSATRYHAGLSDSERKENQDAFIYDQKKIMVATNAFGMGIDKSNVSFVVHYNMPKDLESYYQEAGRAGRDGEEADCILLYNGTDVRLNQFLIEKSEPNPELDKRMQRMVLERDRERLKMMTFYCTTSDCLRAYILRYFGERGPTYCGKCGNCIGDFDTVDITIDAQKILSCIARTNGIYGIKMIVDILRGSRCERIIKYHLDQLSTYGIMKTTTEKQLRSIIDYLIIREFIEVSESDYPTLALAPRASKVLRGKMTLTMKMPKEIVPVKRETVSAYGVDKELLKRLKEVRTDIARSASVPAYIIFSDATLRDMCDKRPITIEQFLSVSGVGEVKQQKYGKRFVDCICTYIKQNEM